MLRRLILCIVLMLPLAAWCPKSTLKWACFEIPQWSTLKEYEPAMPIWTCPEACLENRIQNYDFYREIRIEKPEDMPPLCGDAYRS